MLWGCVGHGCLPCPAESRPAESVSLDPGRALRGQTGARQEPTSPSTTIAPDERRACPVRAAADEQHEGPRLALLLRGAHLALRGAHLALRR